MRVLARIGCTMAGLAVAAPASAWADPPVYYAPAPAGMAAPAPAPANPPHKHKRSLFGGEKLCPDCQRARVKMQDGVNVPPPPPLPNTVANTGTCTACGGHTHMVVSGPVTVGPGAPGMVMAQNGVTVGGEAPGYAVVGSDPTPVGVVQPRYAAAPVPPGFGAGRPGMAPGPRDPSVMMSGYSPAPVEPPGVNRPHILTHLFGVSALGRHHREERERREEAKHASIPYGPQPAPAVNDLPARMVYGR
jgi:hypothetical protein